MKRTIIISIKPEYVEKIKNGEKKFEYRTKACKEDVGSLLVYETYPVKKIVAEVEVVRVIKETPKKLWKMTNQNGGIKKEDFDSYFENQKVAYAYVLGKIHVFDEARSLLDYGVAFAPQSFVYVS